MKELSIEGKAKRYDESIEVAQRFYNNSAAITKKGLEDIFPELKESEDEKMRAMAIKAVYAPEAQSCIKSWGINPDDVIAWLEKQGEQKPIKDICDTCDEKASCANPCPVKLVEQKPIDKVEPKFKVGDEIKTTNEESLTITRIDRWGYWSEDLFICDFDDADKWELVEQKPAWSEEDEKNMETLINVLYAGTDLAYEREINWLKSLKDRVLPQLQQEWSEEKIETCAREAEDNNCIILAKHIRQLKSLRPKSHWKPSKEQIEAINDTIRFIEDKSDSLSSDYLYNKMKELLEQLKAL